MEKICFKCNISKPLEDYYKHKQMSDGHLNKCKSCTKSEADKREKELRRNPDWVEKENKRAREKYHRLGYKNVHIPSKENRDIYRKQHDFNFPEKKLAKNRTCKMKPKVKGNQLHHWSYNIEHSKDIIELSLLEHTKLHRYMIYDQEFFMYRRIDTMELLDTKEKHLEYYHSLKEKP